MDGGGPGIDAHGNPDRPVGPIITALKFYIPDKIKRGLRVSQQMWSNKSSNMRGNDAAGTTWEHEDGENGVAKGTQGVGPVGGYCWRSEGNPQGYYSVPRAKHREVMRAF